MNWSKLVWRGAQVQWIIRYSQGYKTSLTALWHCRTLYQTVSNLDENTDVKHIRIYTRTGDKGKSSLFTGERRLKDDAIFETLGTLDELNAHIGIAREYCLAISALIKKLEHIQSCVFDMGAIVASYTGKKKPLNSSALPILEKTKIEELEIWIDELEETLSPLRNFILPGGGLASAQLHVARAVGRRTERRFWTVYYQALPQLEESVEETQVLLNVGHCLLLSVTDDIKYRLGDFLFVAARFAAKENGANETLYKPQRQTKS
eukprot:jgi/Galph1/4425/GphlegSOOS_G3120.1